jgi:hypothetical protein
MTLHDTLYGYSELLSADLADTDLSPEDRRLVAQRIGEAVRLLQQFGATTRSELVRTFAQPAYDGSIVAERVREIITSV